MSVLSNILSTLGCFIILFSAINFSKTKNLFTSIHMVIISNIYGLSLLMIGIGLDKFNLAALIKIIALILLNIIITVIVTQSIGRRAIINKVIPEGETVKLDYLTEEEIDE